MLLIIQKKIIFTLWIANNHLNSLFSVLLNFVMFDADKARSKAIDELNQKFEEKKSAIIAAEKAWQDALQKHLETLRAIAEKEKQQR